DYFVGFLFFCGVQPGALSRLSTTYYLEWRLVPGRDDANSSAPMEIRVSVGSLVATRTGVLVAGRVGGGDKPGSVPGVSQNTRRNGDRRVLRECCGEELGWNALVLLGVRGGGCFQRGGRRG